MRHGPRLNSSPRRLGSAVAASAAYLSVQHCRTLVILCAVYISLTTTFSVGMGSSWADLWCGLYRAGDGRGGAARRAIEVCAALPTAILIETSAAATSSKRRGRPSALQWILFLHSSREGAPRGRNSPVIRTVPSVLSLSPFGDLLHIQLQQYQQSAVKWAEVMIVILY